MKELGWLAKRYNVYAAFGIPCGNVPWRHDTWAAIAESLGMILDSIEAEAAVRVTQLSSDDAKEIKYGRLLLDDRSNMKWTHANDSDENDDRIIFHGLEVWAPSWNVCTKMDTSPDFYMSITNEKAVRQKVTVNPIYIIALNEKLFSEKQCMRLLSELGRIVRISEVYNSQQKWGKQFFDGFTDSIQDYPHSSLFAIEDIHQSVLSVKSFVGRWTKVRVED
ncbi:MAG TPA: hypothetical protein PKH29_12130 [Oscillospiraceae bacterium]|nr:hypothetical protein [Oscillospiraceae bacterium]